MPSRIAPLSLQGSLSAARRWKKVLNVDTPRTREPYRIGRLLSSPIVIFTSANSYMQCVVSQRLARSGSSF